MLSADVHFRRTRAALKASVARNAGEPLALVEPTDPRDRMRMLYREWVRALPHQPALRAHIERAMVRCRTRIDMGRPW